MAVFVPDASAALAWFFEDETSQWTDALLLRLKSGDSAIVPAHWAMEVANAFLMAMRRGRISKDKITKFLEDLLVLPIRTDPSNSEATLMQVLVCAEQYGLTVYDAAYLELAMREQIALATLDNSLRAAARKAGVSLVHEA
jgi:predicted nucleic acid-binding protein